MKFRCTTLLILFAILSLKAQNNIPIDTTNWQIQAQSYILENFKGKQSIYLQGGFISLKKTKFLNGTIEFDVYLKEEQAFPGVYFRVDEDLNSEEFFLRPHLSGKPDANQAAPMTHGGTAFQLYFGPKYSFPYTYKFDDWTHVKVVVNDNKAQVYMDHSKEPQFSWNLFHESKEGGISFRGGNRSGIHIANVTIDKNATTIVDFKPGTREPIKDAIQKWTISDPFEESQLKSINNLKKLIKNRTWKEKIKLQEGVAADITRSVKLFKNRKKNTVFAKLVIESDKKQTKLFEFGYSDRVVAILNGKHMYWGNNRWRSRDYRYLGTIGLFDGVYLDLKKGKNTLLMAVSEDFGGWLITGKFNDNKGIKVLE
ncbi:hypothetical protein AAON49_02190 [Pseudotenacibaculum sp. MALMAid0570]|uniref:hypothetical protein n=1 Tax=Pseudotenacibaculum sp. MALMAid0570 TaxID=3143938 RepID=UPI0032E0483A